MDDLVTGDKTTQAASEMHDKAKERLALGGFKLRREKVQQCELRDVAKLNDKTKSADESYAKEMLERKEGSRNGKVLGLTWDCNKDLCIFLIVRTCK